MCAVLNQPTVHPSGTGCPAGYTNQLDHCYTVLLYCTVPHLYMTLIVCLFVGCFTSQQHAGVSQGRICSDKLTCCHTEIEVADQTFYLTQSRYTDTGPTSPSADPITPGAWQGSHWSAKCLSHWYDSTPKKSRRKRDSNPGSSALDIGSALGLVGPVSVYCDWVR